jgi:acyl transferase domain-containing protein/acyl-CoA synthetase (AMP-forming)/AMP-acid ligase II/acyl carrier protein
VRTPPAVLTPAFPTLLDLVTARAASQPSAPAFTYLQDGEHEGVRVTFADLDRRARTIAAALQRAGMQGERALMLYSSSLDFVTAFFGCVYAGVVAVPAYPPKANQSFSRLHSIANDAAPRLALTTANLISNLHRRAEQTARFPGLEWMATDALGDADPSAWVRPTVQPADLAFLQYTSGSTGDAKGVMVSHANLLHNLEGLRLRWEMGPESVMVTWLPTFHDLGLVFGVLEPLYTGTHCVMMSPTAFVQRPRRWLQAITRYRATHSLAPNFAYDLAAAKVPAEERAGLDLRSWRMALNAAEPVRAATMRRFSELFEPHGFDPTAFCPAYGLAEGTLHASGLPMPDPPCIVQLDPAELGANRLVEAAPGRPSVAVVGCGLPAPGVDVVIVDPESGTACAPDAVGEIWLGGDSVARGYWRREAATEETFRAALVSGAGPYLRTGDLGFVRDGQLFITGRLKDLVIIRGQNHYPQDIELSAEQSHPALRAGCSAAFSVDASGEEQLVLVAEVERTALRRLSVDEVVANIRQAVAEEHELQIHAIVLVKPATVPKTSSGKIQRRACRAAFLSGELQIVAQWHGQASAEASLDAPPPTQRSREAVRDWLIAHLARAAAVPVGRVDPDEPFSRYGLDSLASVSLAEELQQWLGRPVPAGVAYDYPNINALATALSGEPASAAPVPTDATAGTDGIAIIGMACRLPGADTPEAFWQLLRHGVDAVGRLPESRVPLETTTDAAHQRERAGAFLTQVDGFDAAFFGVSPRETMSMDPQQRLLLETTWEAFEHAGIAPSSAAGSRAGVFIGISSNDYSRLQIKAGVGTDAWSGTGNAVSIAANRLSYALDLRGPSVAVDTACSSSLVAVHLACQSLRLGESEVAIAGGVNLVLSPEWSAIFTDAQMLAPDGRCKTFDASADGYVRGEGCGVVLLKPLAAAREDGDRVLAVIRGSAVNQDGRSHGLTAPNGPSQQDVVRRAVAQARLRPEQVSYVEAHGTGTALGDPIELEALTAALGSARTAAAPLRVGSVKTNIGHLEAAAGIAGLLKVVLAMQHRVIPPHLHFRTPNPYFGWKDAGIEIPVAPTPWGSPDTSVYAGISAFGFGGTNAHVVLEGPPAPSGAERALTREDGSDAGGRGLLLLSARTVPALRAQAERYAAAIAADTPSEGASGGGAAWPDVCATAARGRTHFDVRAAIAADTAEEARQGLAAIAAGGIRDGVWQGHTEARDSTAVAFIYPGQGAQWWGMGRELHASHAVFREAIERCSAALAQDLPVPLADVLYAESGRALLERTEYAQPAGLAVSYALTQMWESLGVQATAVVGHSVGEFGAAVTVGVLDIEAACRLVAARGRLMQPLGGRMAVLLAPHARVLPLTASHDTVAVAAINGPTQTVIAGPADAVEAIVGAATREGISARLLDGAQAFHSAEMEPMLAEWRALTDHAPARPPARTWISTVTGEAISTLPASYWATHVRQPVRYSEAIERLWTEGCRTFVEVGPTAGLATAGAASVDPLGEGLWLTGLRRGRSEWDAVRRAIAPLHVAGTRVNWRAWDPSPRSRVSLPTYPFERKRYWIDAAPSASERAAAGDHAYEVWWDEIAPVEAPAHGDGPATAWVVCGGHTAETMAAIAAGLRTHGAVVAEPAVDDASLARALEIASAHELAGVVYVGGLDAPARDTALDADAVEQTTIDSCLSVAAVVRAMSAAPAHGARLWIVTRGAVAIGTRDREPAVLQAPLWGLGKVVGVEHPDLWGGLIDLDPQSLHPVRDLISCLPLTLVEDQLVVRADRIYAARLAVSARLDDVASGPLRLHGDATYLVTGGTGALGLSVAARLVARGARSIALLSRRGVGGNAVARTAIDAMEAAGATVRVFKADVAREQDLASVIEAIDAQRPRLRGIVHAAGVLDDGVLLSLDRERFSRVFRPKVAGAWNLHRLTKHADLDFFVLFSSAASLVGSAGQANYAAANAFMDALAISRSMSGLPALSVNWGVWAENGLGARVDARHQRRLASLGLAPLSEEDALDAFDRLLPVRGQISVLHADWARYAAAFPRTSMVRAYAPHREEPLADLRLRDALRRVPPDERAGILLAFVLQETAGVLRSEPGQIAPRRGFFDQGMDSLLAMELKRRIESALGVPLPATVTFDHPTPDALAQFLLERSADAPVPPATGRGRRAEAPRTGSAMSTAADEIARLTPEELEALIDREIESLLP